jgi:hypothetical protein
MKIKLCWNYKSVMCSFCGTVEEHIFPEYLDEYGDVQLPLIPLHTPEIWDRCPKCKKIIKYSPLTEGS